MEYYTFEFFGNELGKIKIFKTKFFRNRYVKKSKAFKCSRRGAELFSKKTDDKFWQKKIQGVENGFRNSVSE